MVEVEGSNPPPRKREDSFERGCLFRLVWQSGGLKLRGRRTTECCPKRSRPGEATYLLSLGGQPPPAALVGEECLRHPPPPRNTASSDNRQIILFSSFSVDKSRVVFDRKRWHYVFLSIVTFEFFSRQLFCRQNSGISVFLSRNDRQKNLICPFLSIFPLFVLYRCSVL